MLAYYEEYIADAGEDQEEAVLGELGSPAAVAAKILEDQGEPKPSKPQSRTKQPLQTYFSFVEGNIQFLGVQTVYGDGAFAQFQVHPEQLLRQVEIHRSS